MRRNCCMFNPLSVRSSLLITNALQKSCLEQTEPIFKDFNILDIFKINDYLTAMFMFQYHHLKNLPEEFDHFSVADNQIHQRNTRNSFKLHK